jgi:hypothetical protein
MDMAEAVKPYATREFSEEAATAVKQHEMVVMLFAYGSVQRTVAILAADQFRMREVEERLISVVSARQLDDLSPLPDARYVRFAIWIPTPGSRNQPTSCSIEEIGRRYSKLAEEHTEWESKTIGGPYYSQRRQYYLFKTPMEDFAEARALAKTCFGAGGSGDSVP